MIDRRSFLFGSAALALSGGNATAQEGLGPFMPHEGGVLTTAWGNAFGPDAESWIRFTKITSRGFDINYSSSRGMVAVRRIRSIDRAQARTLVLGFNAKMPLVIEDTVTIGASTVIMDDLRASGRARMDLIPDTGLQPMAGSVSLVRNGFRLPMMVAGQAVTVPATEVSGSFRDGRRRAEGSLIFLANRNNPVLLQYSLQFTSEKTPRTERIVVVTPGAGELSAMEQALATIREYTTRGIHFDFDKATIRPSSAKLLDEIATTLKNNIIWTLSITGHTDSIGDPGYNRKLSLRRAESVRAALVKRGISAGRLTVAGAGASVPIGNNKTLEGRAQNRRVVLARTDR